MATNNNNPIPREYDDENAWTERKTIALVLAVVHHGLSNLARSAMPAHRNTVKETADDFLDWLEDDDA